MSWVKIIGWIGIITNALAGIAFYCFAEDFAEAAVKRKGLVDFEAANETKQLVSRYTKRGLKDLLIAAGLTVVVMLI